MSVSWEQESTRIGHRMPLAPTNWERKEAAMPLPIGTTAKTGESCPESGVWKVVGTPTTTAPIAKGNRMPPYSGKAVTWKLQRLA